MLQDPAVQWALLLLAGVYGAVLWDYYFGDPP